MTDHKVVIFPVCTFLTIIKRFLPEKHLRWREIEIIMTLQLTKVIIRRPCRGHDFGGFLTHTQFHCLRVISGP